MRCAHVLEGIFFVLFLFLFFFFPLGIRNNGFRVTQKTRDGRSDERSRGGGVEQKPCFGGFVDEGMGCGRYGIDGAVFGRCSHEMGGTVCGGC